MNRQGRHPYIRAMIKLGQLYALKKLGDKAGEYVEIRLTPKGKKLKKDIILNPNGIHTDHEECIVQSFHLNL